jgi:4-diphosphocytidyl-2-methyl-D-erithritol synthase
LNCWGVIPAAGIGSRLGAALPKQYLEIAGRTLLEHSLRALFADARVKGVAVALRAGDERAAGLACLRDPRILLTEGGAERAEFVAAGLAALRQRAADDD